MLIFNDSNGYRNVRSVFVTAMVTVRINASGIQ